MRSISILLVAVGALSIGVPRADEAAATKPVPASTAAASSDAPAAPRVSCPSETGSRIKPAKGACSSAAGRSYDADQLQSTGALSAGDALRQLDPMISGSPGH